MRYLKRIIEDKFLELSSFFPVVLLTGARQTGKTTMLRHLADGSDRSYATLDNILTRDLAQKDPVAFFQQYPPPVLIDEVQYAPQLFPVIKLLADESGEAGQFWLTGSQQYSMMRNVQESLAGRVGILRMYGLTQAEKAECNFTALSFDMDSLQKRAQERHDRWCFPDLKQHIWLGTMPRLYTANAVSDAVHDTFFNSYVESYLMRDVSALGGVQDLERFRAFLYACAALTGQQLNFTKLTDAVGISHQTAKRWTDLLVGLGIVYLLQPFTNNALKRLARTPKLYFTDTGLAAWLTRWPASDVLWSGAAAGAFFENAVVMDVFATLNAAPGSFSLSYLRDSNQTEIDLILESHNIYHPFEIKKGSQPRRQEIRKFQALDRAGMNRGAGGIICTAPDPFLIDQQNAYIPAWLL